MKKEYLYPNRLKEYHNFLKENDPQLFAQTILEICDDTGISQSSYYRKLENPNLYSKAEKNAIAKIYRMPVHFIFPEMEKVKKISADVHATG